MLTKTCREKKEAQYDNWSDHCFVWLELSGWFYRITINRIFPFSASHIHPNLPLQTKLFFWHSDNMNLNILHCDTWTQNFNNADCFNDPGSCVVLSCALRSVSAFLLCQGGSVLPLASPVQVLLWLCPLSLCHYCGMWLHLSGSARAQAAASLPSHSEFSGATSYHAELELLALSHLKPDRKTYFCLGMKN